MYRMGKWINRKHEPPRIRGQCVTVGCAKPQAARGYGKYRAVCRACHKATNLEAERRHARCRAKLQGRNRRRPWTKHKKDHCERCGFIPEDPVQLDVDHVDGNRMNNLATNYQTLCANCHRLKTKQNGDGPYKLLRAS